MAEKYPKRPRDLNQWGKRMVDIATGAANDQKPTPEEQGKDPAAGVTERPWEVADMVSVLESRELSK